MRFIQPKFLIPLALLGLILVAATYVVTLRFGMDSLSERGQIRAEQARDRLLGQLASFRQLPNMLSQHPAIVSHIEERPQTQSTNDFLLNTALLSGAKVIWILDQNQRVIASSDFEETPNHIDQDQSATQFAKAATNGRLGVQSGLDPLDGTRVIYFARAVPTRASETAGTVVVQVYMSELEFEWQIDQEVLGFFNAAETAMITNRQELALQSFQQGNAGPLSYTEPATLSGHRILQFSNPTLPDFALLEERFIPQLDMTVRSFLDTKPVYRRAQLASLFAAALVTIVGLIFYVLLQRRARLADRLAIEEAANATLEARVDERTMQLRQTQQQLIQAGKLTAMGQMSAGISHELNQPLAAIQNFAENGTKLLSRDRAAEASDNFSAISNQVDRMSRIVKSLRAFARNEKITIEPVNLAKIIEDALELSKTRARKDSVTITFDRPDTPIMVMGGEVRLQQVIINILTNAMDAMDTQVQKQIMIEIVETATQTRLSISDTGPGIVDADRVFEPFFSTKEIGASKGLGLGLSISYGIIAGFGGDITCTNTGSGAAFEITLRPADAKEPS